MYDDEVRDGLKFLEHTVAPVLADGVLLGALCISGPASRIGTAPGKRLAPMIVEAAADLAALTARP